MADAIDAAQDATIMDGLSLDSSIAAAKPRARLTEEEVLALKIEKKRQVELERRTRIQGAKSAIALDTGMLEQQAAEHRRKKEDERQFNISGDQGLLGANKSVVRAQKEADAKRAADIRAMRDHNLEAGAQKRADQTNQKLKNFYDAPPRDGDLDQRCGVSSLQKFAGEDLMRGERLRQQRQQQIDCIEQQKFEKAMYKKMEEEENRRHAEEVAEFTRMRGELEDGELQLRREMNKKNLQEFVQMHEATSMERKRQKDLELQQNEAEMKFIDEESGVTTELGPQTLADGRIRRDAFKGSTREEKVAAKVEIMKQAAEKDMMREMQKQADQQSSMEAKKVHSMMEGIERQKQRARKAMAAQVCADNLRMQEEARQRKKETNQLFANEISPDFYSQFGTAAR